jgi:DNA-binding NarL/FixJ family response regulator
MTTPQHRAIADRIHLSERTVEAHVTQIFLKLQLPDTPDRHRRAQAVVTYLRS